MKYRTDFTLSTKVIDLEEAKQYLLEDDMVKYLKNEPNLSKELLDKIENITWNLTTDTKGYIELTTTGEICKDDLKIISKWVRVQNADGLGESFEQQEFAYYTEFDYYYKYEGYSLSEVTEMEDRNEISSSYRFKASFDWETNDYIFEKYEDDYKFPIRGTFRSKKGTFWHYTIYSDLYVEQWHSNTERCTGGWKKSKDFTFVDCTKELEEHIKEKYGLTIKR